MAICLEHISKAYEGRSVLDDFTVQMERGGIYCLLGSSGIGKTTLLRILMGLEQPDSGRIICTNQTENGKCREKSADLRIGAVFQEDRLFEFADALKNVRLAVERDRCETYLPEEILSELLEQEAWHRPVSELSGGMRRRVAIARALASSSGLLVMDEPFAGLDERTKRQTIKSILHFRNGRTLLVVTHQAEDAALLGADAVFRL